VLAVLCGAIVGCCVAMAMPLVHLVAHASDLGYGLARGAQMLSTALLCALLGRLAWGAISDRIGGLRTMLATSAWQALGLLALALFDGEVALYVVAAFFGLGYGGLVPAYTVFMREVFPVDGIGLRVGLVLLFGTLGMALGGWLGALVQELTESYRGAFLVGFACNLVNLALLAALGARWRRHRPSAARSAAALGAP
jgi:MFS family permease